MSKTTVKLTLIGLIACLFISTFQLKAQKIEGHLVVNVPLEAKKSLYFSSNKSGTYQIYKKNNTSETRLTTDDNFNFWGIKVSPDKKKFICYRAAKGLIVRDNNAKNSELWLFNIDGSNGQKLISLSDYNWHGHNSASWSPDGKKLLMSAELMDKNDANHYRWHLIVTDSNGKKPVQISTRPAMYAEPVFAPNGKTIAYSAQSTGTPYSLCPAKYMEIYTAQLDSTTSKITNERKLTSNDFWDGKPVFTPKGDYIAYSISPGCLDEVEYFDLQLMSLTGKSFDLKTDKTIKINAVGGNDGFIYFQYKSGLTGNFAIARIKDDGSGFTIMHKGSNYNMINPEIVTD